MKKFFIILLLCFFSLFNFSFIKSIASENDVTVLNDAKYYVEERVDEEELPYGVTYYKDISYSSTDACLQEAADGTCVATKADGGLGESPEMFVQGKFYKQQVNVMEVKQSENLKIVSWANLNDNRWTLSTVKALINDYETKNPGYKVVAAVNGDFFDIKGGGNLPYQSNGAIVSEGENYRTTTGAAVAFTKEGYLIGNFVPTRKEFMTLSVYDDDGNIVNSFDVQKLNEMPLENETSVFFGTFSSSHMYKPKEVDANGYFVHNAIKTLPNNEKDFYGKGVITSTTTSALEEGQFGIVSNNEDVNNALSVGKMIRVQYDFIENQESIYSASGCGDTFLYNGEFVKCGTDNRHPRTVVGKKEDGTLIFMTIDGRQGNSDMHGAHSTEVSAIMKHYGAVEAYNLDGGGSTTFVIKRGGKFTVVNSPSDGNERTDSNALLVVVKEPSMKLSTVSKDESSLTIKLSHEDLSSENIKNLFLELNGERKIFVNNEVTFDNLQSNTNYNFDVYIENNEGLIYRSITQGNDTTLKKIPFFEKLELTSDGENYIFNAIFKDDDESYVMMNIEINGKDYIYQDELSLSKEKIGKIDSLSIELVYNINEVRNVREVILNPDYSWGHLYSSIVGEIKSKMSSLFY